MNGENEREQRMIKNRIKEYRAKYDMKQEDLAKLVGVRRETIGNLEKGKYNPSLVLAWNIAKVFNVSIEEVFTVEE
jgi:putative transcriptional regulator